MLLGITLVFQPANILQPLDLYVGNMDDGHAKVKMEEVRVVSPDGDFEVRPEVTGASCTYVDARPVAAFAEVFVRNVDASRTVIKNRETKSTLWDFIFSFPSCRPVKHR
jgi:hypothetical protein